ncbi:ABC transporter substrate-binding protein [Streptomyces sp. NPDC017936]|uniref:ABC transporter substrate-binding protein n=1 Tax=Streptomyces sp. NPDC017936 TaxID=3365016 RepID=UPI0037A2F4E6
MSAPAHMDNGALYLGVNLGIFEKQGLRVRIEEAPSETASLEAARSGKADFGYAGAVDLVKKLSGGAKVDVVAALSGVAPGYWKKMQAGQKGYTSEVTALVAAADSGIDDPGDLTGKKVAVFDREGQAELSARHVIDSHGGDSQRVTFVEMSMAGARGALRGGEVDAAVLADPYLADATADGARVVSWAGVEALQEGATTALVAAKSFTKADARTAARFRCALREASVYANAHGSAVREAVAGKQGVETG